MWLTVTTPFLKGVLVGLGRSCRRRLYYARTLITYPVQGYDSLLSVHGCNPLDTILMAFAMLSSEFPSRKSTK